MRLPSGSRRHGGRSCCARLRPQDRERTAHGPGDEFSRKLAEATDRNEKIEADCNERVAFIEEKFELDTASLELENNELHAASVRYLADARELDRQVVQLHAEAETMSDEIERLRGERDAALKAQAELNDALLAQRDLMGRGRASRTASLQPNSGRPWPRLRSRS